MLARTAVYLIRNTGRKYYRISVSYATHTLLLLPLYINLFKSVYLEWEKHGTTYNTDAVG